MRRPHQPAPIGMLMAGSALRVAVAAVLVAVLWAAVAWALREAAP